MKCTGTLNKWTLFLTLVILILNSLAVYPIIIRHDRPDADYQKLGEQFRNAYVMVNSPRGSGTGTLIAPRWVLTAAHVAEMFTPQHPSYPKVPQPPKVNVGGRDYAIDKVVLHPDWDTKSLSNDIALLRLAEPVAGIVPIRIYRKQDEVGAIVTFLGRGYPGTGKEGVKTKDLILRAATNRVETADAKWVTFIFDAPDSPNVLPMEGISGPGDSGGPALIEKDGILYTLGVSSNQRTNGKPEGLYGVEEYYSRVSSYADWIDKTIEENITENVKSNYSVIGRAVAKIERQTHKSSVSSLPFSQIDFSQVFPGVFASDNK